MKNQALKKQKHESPLFAGLNERQLRELYSYAPIRKLQKDQVLIQEGDSDQTFYVILEGELRIVKNGSGSQEMITTLDQGNLVGEISFTKQISRTASAIANVSSTVMAIENTTLNSLDEQTQLLIYKHLNELTAKRINDLETRERKLTAKNDQLTGHLFTTQAQDQQDYYSVKMIQAIVKKLPRLPVFAGTLVSKLFSQSVSVNEIASLVQQDPSLLGMVMKTINSSYYGFKNKISDLHHALVLLGFNGLYQLVVEEGVRHTMPKKQVFEDLHAHSVAVSYIGFAISQQSKIGKPAEIATLGLMHDLGKVVLALLMEQNPNLGFLLQSLDPAKLGSVLLREWNLPETVWESVAFQRYAEFSLPSKIPEEFRTNVTILYMAHIVYELFKGRTEKDIPMTFIEEYSALLNWEPYSPSRIAFETILPALIKKEKGFPANFRKILANASEQKPAEESMNSPHSKLRGI